jgi:hypothetical protein
MRIKIVTAITLTALLTGCEASHLIYVQETSLGLSITAGTEGTQKLSLGYDRDVFAVVPKKATDEDAMSLFSINNVIVEGLNDISVSEFVATGIPATEISTKPDAVSALRTKIYGQEN